MDKKYPRFSNYLNDRINHWLAHQQRQKVHYEMLTRFQKARYDLLIQGLKLGFDYNSLYEMTDLDAETKIPASPLQRYGDLKFQRVDYCLYTKLPSGQFSIKTLIGYGYIFLGDRLYFRPS